MSTTRKAIVFLLLTFALSWGACFGGAALHMNTSPGAATGALVLMMAGPAIAATICIFAFEKGRRREAVGLKWTPNGWWFGAWLAAAVLAGLSVLISGTLGGAGFGDITANTLALAEKMVPPDQRAGLDQVRTLPFLSGLLIAQAVIGGLINAPILVFTEELGWRGYLHDLWSRFGFWRCSLATGAIWGLWHAPAIMLYGLNYPEHREIGVGLFILFCTMLAPLMTFIRNQGRSVIAPAITHGAINGFGQLTIVALANPAFPWTGIVGYGGFAALAILLVALVILRSARLARPVAA